MTLSSGSYRGFGGEEENIEDIVVVANDLCSSMIQNILSVDFEEDINIKSYELMSFGKKYYYQVVGLDQKVRETVWPRGGHEPVVLCAAINGSGHVRPVHCNWWAAKEMCHAIVMRVSDVLLVVRIRYAFIIKKHKDVVPQQNGHWGAQLYTNNQRIWIGTFKTKKDAAMAYDRASIKLRSYDSPRNFPWSQTTDLEAKFQSHLNMEVILKMIKDETYESKFNNFLKEKTGKEKDDDLSVQNNCANFCRLLFENKLTPSDVGKLNRLVIAKKFVVAYFPPVPDNDHSEGFVNDEVILPFYDVDNKLWKFRYCYWKSSKSFVFTRGWNQFVKEKTNG
nr:AP2/ERF and B3 domain-containing transcription factor At1g50680-like [Tanacetum cinerariifolium]